MKGDVEQAILEWCTPPLPLHPAYSCNPWAALAPAMLLDYNNVGGVRWRSISELCIIEINPLLAPHVNTINKYEACEGRCGTSHLGMVQPPSPPTLHLYTAQSYAFKALLTLGNYQHTHDARARVRPCLQCARCPCSCHASAPAMHLLLPCIWMDCNNVGEVRWWVVDL